MYKNKQKKKIMFSAFSHVSSVDVGMLNPVGQAHNIGAFVLYKLYGSPGFLKWFLLGWHSLKHTIH